MSHFLYVHADLTGVPDVWKIGVAMTPYSAVRARQKYCWQQFKLDHIWFGFPKHIEFIEQYIKHALRSCSGKALQNFGTQTEIFQINILELRSRIAELIKSHNLCVMELVLDQPYVASNSGQCPFGIPNEKNATAWLDDRAKKAWPAQAHVMHEPIFITTSRYKELFEEC